jgi:hypothetical protein
MSFAHQEWVYKLQSNSALKGFSPCKKKKEKKLSSFTNWVREKKVRIQRTRGEGSPDLSMESPPLKNTKTNTLEQTDATGTFGSKRTESNQLVQRRYLSLFACSPTLQAPTRDSHAAPARAHQ